MSPEQAAGEEIDQRTDLFAVGVVLYELLRGGPHSLDLSDAAVLRKMPRADFEPLARPVPALLRDVLHRSLERFPGDRFATAAEFRSALLEVQRQHGRGFDRSALSALMHRVFDEAWRARRGASRPGLLEIATDPATSPYLAPGGALPLHGSPSFPGEAREESESLARLSTVHLIPRPDPEEVPPPPPPTGANKPYQAPEHLPPDTDQTHAYYPSPRAPKAPIARNLDTDPETVVPGVAGRPVAPSLDSERATMAPSLDTDRATVVREPASPPLAQEVSDPVFELHREPTPIFRAEEPRREAPRPPRAAAPAPQPPHQRPATRRAATELLEEDRGRSGLFAQQATLARERSGEIFAEQALPTTRERTAGSRTSGRLRVVAQGLVVGVLLVAGGYGIYFLTRPLPEEPALRAPPPPGPTTPKVASIALPDLAPSPAGEPRPRRLARLYIGSKPAGARITVCGHPEENRTPATLEIDADQPCTLVLELEGYAAYATQVQATADQLTTVVATLRRVDP